MSAKGQSSAKPDVFDEILGSNSGNGSAGAKDDLWSDAAAPLGALESVVSREKTWSLAASLVNDANQVGRLGGEAAKYGEQAVDDLTPSLATSANNKPVQAIQSCQCPKPGSAVDISPNDLMNFAGAVVNLPLAVLLRVVAEVDPSFGQFLLDNLYTKFGTGDHTGGTGFVFGDASRYADPDLNKNPDAPAILNNDPDNHKDGDGNPEDENEGKNPGILGIAMGLAHREGVWGDAAVFEKEQYCHNIATLPGQKSQSGDSAIQTVGEGVGIFAKQLGIGPWLSDLVKPDENNTGGFVYGVYIGAMEKKDDSSGGAMPPSTS